MTNIPTVTDVRPADVSELEPLARVWYHAWRDAHAHVVPAALIESRTLAGFRERLAALLPEVRVVGPPGAPLGFCIIRDDEVYQLFVAAEARGSGVAARLMADAESRLRARGVEVAWLACVIGNHRAARFYEKCGWYRAGTMVSRAQASSGTLPLEVWRYEKRLAPPARART